MTQRADDGHVNDTAPGPAGLLVLHLWTETDDRMRVRITRTADLTAGHPSTSYASTKAEVLEAVAGWLDSFAAR